MGKKTDNLLLLHGDGEADTGGYHARFYDQEQSIRDTDSKTTQKHGVVYTPVACVDFINRSVASILQREFGVSMDSPDVEVIDPFAGTGLFLCRAIENGLIDPEKQTIRQIELMPDSAEIARENIELSLRKMGKAGNVETICTDTFTLDPQTLEGRER